jgi:predicted MFS family arabinose efflux permease
VASALGGAVAWVLVDRGAALATLYLVTACTTCLAAVVGASLPEPSRPSHGPRRTLKSTVLCEGRALAYHATRALSIVARRGDFRLLLGLSAMLFPVLRVGLFLDQPYLLQLGFGTAAVGLVFAAKDLVAAAAAASTARLLRAFGEPPLLASLPIAVGLALLAMPFFREPAAAALVLLPTAAFGIYSPLVRVFVNRRLASGLDRATVLSIESMARRLGFAIFSPIVGAVFDLWSLDAALLASSIWALLGIGLAGPLLLAGRKASAAAEAGPAGGGALGRGAVASLEPATSPSAWSSRLVRKAALAAEPDRAARAEPP